MRNRRKQYNNGNVVHCKKNVAPLQIKEEKLLAKNKILPDSASDEGVKTVSTEQGKKNVWKDFVQFVMPKLFARAMHTSDGSKKCERPREQKEPRLRFREQSPPEPRKARHSEFSCFCVAKCEPFGEQKKTR